MFCRCLMYGEYDRVCMYNVYVCMHVCVSHVHSSLCLGRPEEFPAKREVVVRPPLKKYQLRAYIYQVCAYTREKETETEAHTRAYIHTHTHAHDNNKRSLTHTLSRFVSRPVTFPLVTRTDRRILLLWCLWDAPRPRRKL